MFNWFVVIFQGFLINYLIEIWRIGKRESPLLGSSGSEGDRASNRSLQDVQVAQLLAKTLFMFEVHPSALAEEEIKKGKSLTPRKFSRQIGIGGPTQFMSIARLIGSSFKGFLSDKIFQLQLQSMSIITSHRRLDVRFKSFSMIVVALQAVSSIFQEFMMKKDPTGCRGPYPWNAISFHLYGLSFYLVWGFFLFI